MFLTGLGIVGTMAGAQYLHDAITFALEDHELIERITKLLYPQIAKVHNTTPSRIERAIRVAIERSWSLASMEYKKRIFGEMASVNSTRPTNMQYIQCIVNYLK